MVFFQRLLVVISSMLGVQGKFLRTAPSHQHATEPVRMILKNIDDMSVLVTVQFGNQEMSCIPDTGSVDQVAFSQECENCGGKMYDCDKDPSCHWGNQTMVQTYGSGETYSVEAYTKVVWKSIAGASAVVVKNLMVWLVTEAELDFEMDGTMQCIFGLGPASAAPKFAELEYDTLRDFLDKLPKDQAKQYEPKLREFKDRAQFMKGVTLWQEAAHAHTFSVCLHSQLGSDGRIVMHDDAPERYPGMFVSVDTTTIDGNDLYWQLPMKNASIKFAKTVQGCKDGCVAIMDTGTSLIGAPWKFVEALSSELDDQISSIGGCDDDVLHRYPNFNMHLGAHVFTLPPRSYVCQFAASEEDDGQYYYLNGKEGDYPGLRRKGLKHRRPQVHRRMRHLKIFREAHMRRLNRSLNQDDFYCAPCMFEMDGGDSGGDDSNRTEQWLFGLPFFREYYSTFQTTSSGDHTSKMMFAKASGECHVGNTKDHLEERVAAHTVQRIDPKRLRLPPMRGSPETRARRMQMVRMPDGQ